MIRLAVTGGMASGKSAFCRFLSKQGARVADMDLVARDLLDNDHDVRNQLNSRFGAEVCPADKPCDRALLARKAFASAEGVEALEGILHPAIRRERDTLFSSWEKEADGPEVAVAEAALILESGTQDDFDWVVLVVADREERINRLAERSIPPEDAAKRMDRQWQDERKRPLAHIVVENDGTLEELEDKAGQCLEWVQGHQPGEPVTL